jgi:hypothetical protein
MREIMQSYTRSYVEWFRDGISQNDTALRIEEFNQCGNFRWYTIDPKNFPQMCRCQQPFGN